MKKFLLALLLTGVLALSACSRQNASSPALTPSSSPSVSPPAIPAPSQELTWPEELSIHTGEALTRQDAEVRKAVTAYYEKTYCRAYFADTLPEAAQDGDFRIDHLTYTGAIATYESIGAAYEIQTSRCWERQGSLTWNENDSAYLVVRCNGYSGELESVLGESRSITAYQAPKEAILETVCNLSDIEVSLWRDGFPSPIGPGSAPPNYPPTDFETEVLEGWEPIYQAGDYWFRQTTDDFTALYYHNAIEDADYMNRLTTTWDDLSTYRGIRVGSTWEEVLAAYPGIFDTAYWDKEGDYLWYCRNEGGWGPALLLYFEDDTVSSFELIDMFD